ncbi:MAG TPA: BTAD domain-containing putative transcriptional regulator [Solirubrobacteraceae bacterium]|nr:BTAD domain-containing putative transcriptional regulator [Solirubrobacteraceae bacterium]
MALVTEMAELRIELLGGFHVVSRGRAIPEEVWQRRKAAALFKLLALAPRHRLHREQVMDALWPELAPAAAAANLRKAVYYARQAVPGEEGARLVGSVGELLCLPSEGLWIDVDAFRDAAARSRQTGDPASYWEAVGLYRDGLLPDDRYEEWVIGRRDELRFEFLAIVEELAALLEARGDLAGSTKAVGLLIADEPLEEAAHVRLMRLYALAGRRGEALRQYERLREMLAAELGREPGVEAQRLYEEIRARQVAEPELSAELWERVGELRIGSGDTTGALNAFELALDAADSPPVVARLHRRSAGALLMQHDAERADEHLRIAESTTEDPAELARLTCLRANQAWERRELDRAQELALRARELAAVDGEPDDLAAAEEALAIVSHFRGDWRHGLEIEIGRTAGGGSAGAALGRVFDIHHCIGQYHLYGDGLGDDVEPYARRVLALAEQVEAVRAQAFAWCLLGESLLLHARWDEAAGCLERSCDLHGTLGTTSGALPWQRLAELAVCRGAAGEADAALRRAAAIATVSPMAMHMWGRIHATAAFAGIEQGDPEAAAGSVRAAAAAAARYGDCPSCSALLNPIAAETFAALGDRERARAHAEAAKRVASFFDSSAWRAMSESAWGSVAVVDGVRTVARERFTAAAELYERAGHSYWAERSWAQAAAA